LISRRCAYGGNFFAFTSLLRIDIIYTIDVIYALVEKGFRYILTFGIFVTFQLK